MSKPAAPRPRLQPPRPPRRNRKPMPLPTRARKQAAKPSHAEVTALVTVPFDARAVPFDARATVMSAPRATAAATQPVVVEARPPVSVVPAKARPATARPTANSRDLRPGDVVAQRYRVTSIISRNRGLLLDASRTAFDQRVAIRVLTRSMVESKAVQQFHREAGILARLESEHVARIADFGQLPDGALYLAREYVRGQSLASLAADKGGLPLEEAVLYVLQVAEAVQEAHTQGVVLRDLRAAHVFLAEKRNGAVAAKLTDFGTCKVVRDASAGGELSCTRLLGLSSSASPELVRQSKNIGVAADVWSLGCMLYELVTGRPAFAGEGVQLALDIARKRHTPASSHRADLPAHFDKVMDWALAKEPQHRFRDVYAFAHELRGFACRRGCLLIEEIGRLATGCVVAPIERVVETTAAVALPQHDEDATSVMSKRIMRELPKARPPRRRAPSQPLVVEALVAEALVARPNPVLLAAAARPPLPSSAADKSGPQAWMLDAEVPPQRGRRWAWLAAVPAAAAVIFGLSFAASTPAASASGGMLTAAASGIDVSEYAAQISDDAAAEADALQGTDEAAAAASDAEHADEKSDAKPEKRAVSAKRRVRRKRAQRGGQFLGAHNRRKTSKSLSSADEKPAGRGTLVAMAVGSSCSFAVDGAGRGTSSSIRVAVSAGTHTVSCTQAGGSSRTRRVRVAPGKAAVAVFKF